jgi:hypothetical protein
MLRLLERNIRSIDQRLVLLAPSDVSIPDAFRNVAHDPDRHRQLVREMQIMRGGIYLRDGAVERRHLSPDGVHRTPEDEKSWHLLMTNREQHVSSCAWYLQHENTIAIDRLRIRNCPLAQEPESRRTLWRAVGSELAQAQRDHLHYAEVGGWAVTEESRCTSEGLVLALAAYSLGRLCGGTLGITTATVRHCSSTILRRIGGAPLEADGTAIPQYYDPTYRCSMELLRFDSRRPSAKFRAVIERLEEMLSIVPVVTAVRSLAFDGAYEPATFAENRAVAV